MASAKQANVTHHMAYWPFFQHRGCQASPAAVKEKEYSPAIWESCIEGVPQEVRGGACVLHGTEIHRIWLHPWSTPQGAEAPGPPSQLSHYVARNRDPLKPPQEKGCLAWNWEAAENQGSSRAGRPSWDVGFLFPSLRFFRFHVVFFSITSSAAG